MNKHKRDTWRMDWKTLIEEIQATGLSQVEIARRLNKSQAWVSAVLAGKYEDLKWNDGQALIALRDTFHTATKKAA